MFDMLSDVTILVPSFNRHRQLKRLLEYYKGLKTNILVGDSTLTAFPDAGKYKNLNYFHYPNYPYATKLALMYKKIKTKYVLFCADDDFVIPNSVKECVNFLDKNPDYVAAHGHYVFFEDKGKDKIPVYPFYLHAIDLDVKSNLPSERLYSILANYMQLLYAVTKTSVARKVFNQLEKNRKIQNDTLVELFQAIMISIEGKSKTLPSLYCAREVTPGSARTRIASLENIVTEPKYKKEYSYWLKVIIDYLMKKQKISKPNAEASIKAGVNNYLKGLLFTIPIINFHLYPLQIQMFIIKATFGYAKKIRDLLIAPKDYANLSKHAFSTPHAKKEFEKIKLYIKKYGEKSLLLFLVYRDVLK